jgi:medium-chain acyl-[acyl-carrier-protein] hydrolase
MRALLAFELTRRLGRELGATPVRLFVSGRRAPHLPDSRPPVGHLTDADFVAEIRRRYDGIPAEVLRHTELLQLLLPALRADIALLEGHACTDETPVDCPIAAWGGLGDDETSRESLAAWGRHTRAGCSVRMFPGDHFFVQQARPLVLEALVSDLAPALSGSCA